MEEQKENMEIPKLIRCPMCQKEAVYTIAVKGSNFLGRCIYCEMVGEYTKVEQITWQRICRGIRMDSVSKSKCDRYIRLAFAAGVITVFFILSVLAALDVVNIESLLNLSG